MTKVASQITSLTVVYSIVYSGADQRKHQSSASLAFVRGIHRRPVNSPHKWPVTRKMFPFDDVIMCRQPYGCDLRLEWWVASGTIHEMLLLRQVEEAHHTDILFLHGTSDMFTDPRLMLNVASRLLDHGHTGVSVHMYQGAGHILEPPYIPFCYASWHKLCGRQLIYQWFKSLSCFEFMPKPICHRITIVFSCVITIHPLQHLYNTACTDNHESMSCVVIPDSKVHGANVATTWGRQDPGGPHVGPMNFVIWDSSDQTTCIYR